MEIKNIIFDLGGVFINLDNKLTEKAFVEMGVAQFGQFFGHGFAASFFREYELGKISDAEFISHLRTLGKLDAPDEAIISAWNELLLDFPPERIRFLQNIRGRYRLFLFSNTNALHMARVRSIFQTTFAGGSLEDFFDKTYYSHEIGLRKPELESYYYILGDQKLEAAHTLFVDDALVNVEGAIAAGLQGHFLAPGTTVLDLVL